MKKSIILSLACFVLMFFSGALQTVHAGALSAKYSVEVAGVGVAKVVVNGEFKEDEYEISLWAKSRALVRWISKAKILANGSGKFTSVGVFPESYSLNGRFDHESDQVSIKISGRNVTSFEARPPVKAHPRRIPVGNKDRENVVDPIGAMILRTKSGLDPLAQENCNQIVRVFDGRQRFNVRLSYSRTETIRAVKAGSYAGAALVCSLRYEPVSGHRSNRKTLRELAANKSMEVTLVPVNDTLLGIYSMRAKTSIGLIVFQPRFYVIKTAGS